ncbi:hypothetical protein [Pseudomonas sp. Au-Pse12]|uniref:hypothetical protein n=1 Tax=Pseudomonas sp. Au-Pse12 TaxID=2906459 RepID=UPI001E3D0DB9|nr:hypothetical protein [Pseudomonas sp. Au-Pse12]MCE4055839.1 hypothetical protein [Pseudomonas sp. Au-Pse12]
MNLFLTLATLVFGVITLVSAIIYLSRRAKYCMNLQAQSIKHVSIAGTPVEFPYPMDSFLADSNQAEVVIAKKFTVVIGLNGHRLAL